MQSHPLRSPLALARRPPALDGQSILGRLYTVEGSLAHEHADVIRQLTANNWRTPLPLPSHSRAASPESCPLAYASKSAYPVIGPAQTSGRCPAVNRPWGQRGIERQLPTRERELPTEGGRLARSSRSSPGVVMETVREICSSGSWLVVLRFGGTAVTQYLPCENQYSRSERRL